jgi:hypothetical protein
MARADDDDAGVASIEERRMIPADDDDAGVASDDEERRE